MNEEIYVLVLVEYDYFRFQENLHVGTKEECINKISGLFTDYPIYTYEKGSILYKALGEEETKHYWLQKF